MAMLYETLCGCRLKFISSSLQLLCVCVCLCSRILRPRASAHCLHQPNKIRTSNAMANDSQSYLSNCGTLNNSIFPQSSGWRWIHCYREQKKNNNKFETILKLEPMGPMSSVLVTLAGRLVKRWLDLYS